MISPVPADPRFNVPVNGYPGAGGGISQKFRAATPTATCDVVAHARGTTRLRCRDRVVCLEAWGAGQEQSGSAGPYFPS